MQNIYMAKSSNYWTNKTLTKKGKVRVLSKRKYAKIRRDFKKKYKVDIGSYDSYKKRS